jgi:hypothetical protein
VSVVILIKTMHKAGLDFGPSMAMVHSGFIAQEVEQACTATNYTNSIVHHPANDNDAYALAYAELVVPLVKAVQELSHIVDSLRGITNRTGQRSMQNNNNDSIIGNFTQNNNNSTIGNSITNNSTPLSINNIDLASGNAIIYQNTPNPFGDGTMIKYFIPENISNAQIIFYDEFGNQLKTFAITETRMGQLNIASANLAPGAYSYSLIINGKVIDTKKMIKTN